MNNSLSRNPNFLFFYNFLYWNFPQFLDGHIIKYVAFPICREVPHFRNRCSSMLEITLEKHAVSASNGMTFPFSTACFSGPTEHCSWFNKHSTATSKELKQALLGLLTGHRLTAWSYKQAAMLNYAVRGGTICCPSGTSVLFSRNFH